MTSFYHIFTCAIFTLTLIFTFLEHIVQLKVCRIKKNLVLLCNTLCWLDLSRAHALSRMILVDDNWANLGNPTLVVLPSGLMPILVTLRSKLALFFNLLPRVWTLLEFYLQGRVSIISCAAFTKTYTCRFLKA